MATEEDRTETGVAGTAIAIGVAAMIAGSAALVGMARTEMQSVKEEQGGFADLATIRELDAQQMQRLTNAKLPIDKATADTLAAIKRDPNQASPWTSEQDIKVAPTGSATPAETGDAGTAAPEEGEQASVETGTPSAHTGGPAAPTSAHTGSPAAPTSAAATAAEASPPAATNTPEKE